MVIPEVIVPKLSIVTRSSSSSSWTTLAARFPVNRIYCVGRNYREHALEMGANPDRDPPFFFQKPANAVVDTSTNDQIPFPPMTSNLHHEGELVVAIAKAGINMNEQEANECIYGYAVGCDLTRRDLQEQAKKQSRPWDTAKGFDCSAPCGPIMAKNDVLLENSTLLRLKVGNEIKQEGTLGQMIWSIPETLVHLSRYFKLMPGDLVMTGTPAGVGPLQVGNSVKISCGGLPPCEFSIIKPNL
jgi:fumarylpyruvate hydrolase